jgi:hypothetical protein
VTPMKPVTMRVLLLVAVWLCCGVAARAGTLVSVRALLQDPDRYNGKVVSVVGRISAYREAVTSSGGPYTTFRLTDEGASVAVFIWNKQGLGDGQRVLVTGAFEHGRPYAIGEGEIQANRIEPVP